MALLIAGIALWWAAHLFKRVAPGLRGQMGTAGKGIAAVLIIGSIMLMVLGYKAADLIPVWQPPSFMTHINNLLMLLAFYLFGVGAAKGTLAAKIRHPQLTAFKTWAVAHLLVNGDVASILLFGGLLAWAVVSVILINRATEWERPEAVSVRGDIKALIIGLVLMAIVMAIHVWAGVSPVGG